jgi:hypothetical protein
MTTALSAALMALMDFRSLMMSAALMAAALMAAALMATT